MDDAAGSPGVRSDLTLALTRVKVAIVVATLSAMSRGTQADLAYAGGQLHAAGLTIAVAVGRGGQVLAGSVTVVSGAVLAAERDDRDVGNIAAQGRGA